MHLLLARNAIKRETTVPCLRANNEKANCSRQNSGAKSSEPNYDRQIIKENHIYTQPTKTPA